MLLVVLTIKNVVRSTLVKKNNKVNLYEFIVNLQKPVLNQCLDI